MKIWIVTALAVFAAQAPAPQVPAAIAPGIIEGQVVRYGSTDAVPQATVTQILDGAGVSAGVRRSRQIGHNR